MNLENYAPVADRLVLFWTDHPNGRIVTEIVVDDGQRIVTRAAIYRDIADDRPVTTGFAEEVRGTSQVNRTSALENCETSAIGRALANWKYQASDQRPSREEMTKVARFEGAGNAGVAGPTDAQKRMLRSLGHAGPMPQTKRDASTLIDELKAKAYAASEGPEDPF